MDNSTYMSNATNIYDFSWTFAPHLTDGRHHVQGFDIIYDSSFWVPQTHPIQTNFHLITAYNRRTTSFAPKLKMQKRQSLGLWRRGSPRQQIHASEVTPGLPLARTAWNDPHVEVRGYFVLDHGHQSTIPRTSQQIRSIDYTASLSKAKVMPKLDQAPLLDQVKAITSNWTENTVSLISSQLFERVPDIFPRLKKLFQGPSRVRRE